MFENSGLAIVPGRYTEDMIEAFEAKYGAVKAQKVPSGPEIHENDGTSLLGYDEALQVFGGISKLPAIMC